MTVVVDAIAVSTILPKHGVRRHYPTGHSVRLPEDRSHEASDEGADTTPIPLLADGGSQFCARVDARTAATPTRTATLTLDPTASTTSTPTPPPASNPVAAWSAVTEPGGAG